MILQATSRRLPSSYRRTWLFSNWLCYPNTVDEFIEIDDQVEYELDALEECGFCDLRKAGVFYEPPLRLSAEREVSSLITRLKRGRIRLMLRDHKPLIVKTSSFQEFGNRKNLRF